MSEHEGHTIEYEMRGWETRQTEPDGLGGLTFTDAVEFVADDSAGVLVCLTCKENGISGYVDGVRVE